MMKLTHILILTLIATNAIYIYLRQSQDVSLFLICISGFLGGLICFILFMIREWKVLKEKMKKVPIENLFGVAMLSLIASFTVLTIPLIVELFLK